VTRLVEQPSIDADYGIASDYPVIRPQRADGQRLRFGETGGDRLKVAPAVFRRILVDVRGHDFELDTGVFEDLAANGTSGSENEHVWNNLVEKWVWRPSADMGTGSTT